MAIVLGLQLNSFLSTNACASSTFCLAGQSHYCQICVFCFYAPYASYPFFDVSQFYFCGVLNADVFYGLRSPN